MNTWQVTLARMTVSFCQISLSAARILTLFSVCGHIRMCACVFVCVCVCESVRVRIVSHTTSTQLTLEGSYYYKPTSFSLWQGQSINAPAEEEEEGSRLKGGSTLKLVMRVCACVHCGLVGVFAGGKAWVGC